MNQIVETFSLGEVEFSIFERAAGKFAGLGGPDILETRERREQRRQHRAAAMDVKFRDILAGRTGRARKPQRHRIVDRLPVGFPQQDPHGHPWHRNFA